MIRDAYPLQHNRVLYAMSRDKDVRTCVRHIVRAAPHDHIHFAQVTYIPLLRPIISLINVVSKDCVV